jgi:hypothetical protein
MEATQATEVAPPARSLVAERNFGDTGGIAQALAHKPFATITTILTHYARCR